MHSSRKPYAYSQLRKTEPIGSYAIWESYGAYTAGEPANKQRGTCTPIGTCTDERNTKVTCARLECLNLPLPIPTYTVNFFTLGLKCFHIDRRRPKILGDRCTDTVAQQSSLTHAPTFGDLGARFPQIFQLCAKKGACSRPGRSRGPDPQPRPKWPVRFGLIR